VGWGFSEATMHGRGCSCFALESLELRKSEKHPKYISKNVYYLTYMEPVAQQLMQDLGCFFPPSALSSSAGWLCPQAGPLVGPS
jgi:hypothetical protein